MYVTKPIDGKCRRVQVKPTTSHQCHNLGFLGGGILVSERCQHRRSTFRFRNVIFKISKDIKMKSTNFIDIIDNVKAKAQDKEVPR